MSGLVFCWIYTLEGEQYVARLESLLWDVFTFLYVCLEHCNLIVCIVTTVSQQYTSALGVVHDTETGVCIA